MIRAITLAVAMIAADTVIDSPGVPVPTAASRETEWSAHLAGTVSGEAEHRLPDGSRVDILTDTTAWEVEWTSKWPESIGQALYYGAATNRRPGVWLLKRPTDSDEDWCQCLAVIQHLRGHGVEIEFRTEVITGTKPSGE